MKENGAVYIGIIKRVAWVSFNVETSARWLAVVACTCIGRRRVVYFNQIQ